MAQKFSSESGLVLSPLPMRSGNWPGEIERQEQKKSKYGERPWRDGALGGHCPEHWLRASVHRDRSELDFTTSTASGEDAVIEKLLPVVHELRSVPDLGEALLAQIAHTRCE